MSGNTAEAHHHHTTTLPSEHVQPTRTDSVPQQGSTQPGDGSTVRETTGPDGQPLRIVEVPAEHHEVPFKDQVIGYAKKTRGTVLGQPDVKEHGEQILHGTATVSTPPARPAHETSAI